MRVLPRLPTALPLKICIISAELDPIEYNFYWRVWKTSSTGEPCMNNLVIDALRQMPDVLASKHLHGPFKVLQCSCPLAGEPSHFSAFCWADWSTS